MYYFQSAILKIIFYSARKQDPITNCPLSLILLYTLHNKELFCFHITICRLRTHTQILIACGSLWEPFVNLKVVLLPANNC